MAAVGWGGLRRHMNNNIAEGHNVSVSEEVGMRAVH